jgi:hypothetical protein
MKARLPIVVRAEIVADPQHDALVLVEIVFSYFFRHDLANARASFVDWRETIGKRRKRLFIAADWWMLSC